VEIMSMKLRPFVPGRKKERRRYKEYTKIIIKY
jgi:hypothetical protein